MHRPSPPQILGDRSPVSPKSSPVLRGTRLVERLTGRAMHKRRRANRKMDIQKGLRDRDYKTDAGQKDERIKRAALSS